MKKLLWFFGAVFFMLLVAIVTIPLFVDVDQYRPALVAQVNQKINGKFELGHLKLSLWGAVKVNADSIKLSVNGFTKPVLDTNQFRLEIPFSSIFAGHPQVIAVLDQPKISVEKNASGAMNLMKLMKTENGANIVSVTTNKTPVTQQTKVAVKVAPTPTAAPVATPVTAAAAQESTKIPALLVGAQLGLSIQKGVVEYTDATTNSKYGVEGLDFTARNLGFASTMQVTFTAPLQGAAPQMKFDGIVSGNAEVTPVLVGTEVRSAKGHLEIDATKLAIEAPSFHKTKEMPLDFKLTLDGNDKDLLVKDLQLQFDEFKVYGKGLVQTAPTMSAKFEINTDPMHLERIQNFVPMVAQYGLKGVASLNVSLETNGTVHHANGDIKLSDGEVMMNGVLKAPLKFNLQAGFSENSLILAHANLTGPDTELQLQGNVNNFLAPQFNFTLNGKSFNVDQTIVLPQAAPKKSAAIRFEEEAEAAAPAAGSVNPMLAMANNPMVMKAAGTFTAQVGRITAYGTNIDAVSAKVTLAKMLLRIQPASLKAFGGQANASAEFDLKSQGLSYKSQGSVTDVSAAEAFTTYFPKYKNTVDGKVNANWNVAGQIYPQTAIMHSLSGTAKFAANDGALRSVDFQDSINSALAKVPFLKNKSVKVDNGFKTMSADIKFQSGVVNVDPIQMTPRGKGFVIKGKSRIQENMDQESFFDIYDPQGQLPKEIAPKAGAPTIQLHLTGPVSAPQTDYAYTAQRLASNAARGAATSALQNLGKSMGGGNSNGAAKAIGDKLKKLKLFGN